MCTALAILLQWGSIPPTLPPLYEELSGVCSIQKILAKNYMKCQQMKRKVIPLTLSFPLVGPVPGVGGKREKKKRNAQNIHVTGMINSEILG